MADVSHDIWRKLVAKAKWELTLAPRLPLKTAPKRAPVKDD